MGCILKISVHGKILTPFLQSGLEMVALGFDQSALRDHEGRWIISGELLEGNLRHLAEASVPEDETVAINVDGQEFEIADNDLQNWFGSVQTDGSGRAALKIFDLALTLPDDTKNRGIATVRNAHDKITGAVRQGAMFATEQPDPGGKEHDFGGDVRCLVADQAEADRLIAFLNFLSQMIPLIGAQKSAGWGVLKGLTFKQTSCEPVVVKQADTLASGEFKLVITSAHPLLVSPRILAGNSVTEDRRGEGNIQDGLEHIPGGVIFGAIDDVLKLAGVANDTAFLEMKQHLVVRHALPSRNDDRPTPASFWKTQVSNDLERHRDDWKGEERVSEHGLNMGNLPDRWFRTRTAIDPDTLGPQGEMLFTQISARPKDIKWIGALHLDKKAPNGAQKAFAGLLEWLKGNGLPRLGKNAVPIKLSCEEVDREAQSPNGDFCLRLVTDAWLVTGASGNVEEEYKEYFQQFDLDLTDFQAAQTWHMPTMGSRGPVLLTKAGSMFRLRGGNGKLLKLNDHNLPNADPNLSFNECPFVPANGYGEFTLESVP